MNTRTSRTAYVFFALLIAGALSLAAQETLIYSFNQANGGAYGPNMSMIIDSKGNLYGIAQGSGGVPVGAVFELSPTPSGTWTAKVLHDFSKGTSDGNTPRAPLTLDNKGNLFGTTYSGGKNNLGIVFELTPVAEGPWKEQVIYNFGESPSDASNPSGAAILDDQGSLYGAAGGGSDGKGSIYKLVPGSGGEWTEQILFSFTDPATQGSYPMNLIFDGKGNLYGTATAGSAYQGGAIFELSPQSGSEWQEKVLYSFGSTSTDGNVPESTLIFDPQGNLYGTTYGGGEKCGFTGLVYCGTVFELSPAGSGWTEKVIYSMGPTDTDPADPLAGVIRDPQGNLYGTTENGGTGKGGTVFEVSSLPTGGWNGKILHDFIQNNSGGFILEGGLTIDSSGNLYGPAAIGGTYGGGAIFEIYNPSRTGTPTFNPPAGTYNSAQKVTLSDYSPGAKFYYTTNGDDPTTSSEKYSGPIEVTESETIKAMAVAEGLSDSEIGSAAYTLELPCAKPQISPPTGYYDSVQTVTITDKSHGATIYYTTDGSEPSRSSTRYAAPFSVAQTETVEAVAIGESCTESGLAMAEYSIDFPPAATPVISPKSGAYKKGQKITISDANGGAKIYYTLDGSTPTKHSTLYTSAGITLTKAETVKAIATAPDHSKSTVATAVYTLAP